MPVTIRQNEIQIKDDNGVYHSIDAFAGTSPEGYEERISAVENDINELDTAITAMSTATSTDVGKALKAKTVTNGKVVAWEFGEAGGGGGGSTDVGNIQIVENMTELLSTTSDYVMVLNNDSSFGNEGPCIFYDQGSQRRNGGYLRTNGTRVYPLPSTAIPPSNAPKRALTNIIKTWVGRENIVHPPTGTAYEYGLFAENCVPYGDGTFSMDCSDFVSAVLLGITYDNSRYVLGKDASNIKNEMLTLNKTPASILDGKALDGLGAAEWAQWFAEQGRLFRTGTSGEAMGKKLRFGDIIFGSKASSTSAARNYCDIEHIMFVLGTMQSTNNVWFIILAECTGDSSLGNEGTSCFIRTRSIANNNTYFRYFARPNYRDVHEMFSTLTPIKNGKYTYDCFWIPCTGNQQTTATTESGGILLAGHKYSWNFKSSTNYCPAIPGSTITYTGNATSTTTSLNYFVRCFEYDENFNFKRYQNLAYGGNGYSITILDTTKYIQFTLEYSSKANTLIRYSDTDDFAVEVTLPTEETPPAST